MGKGRTKLCKDSSARPCAGRALPNNSNQMSLLKGFAICHFGASGACVSIEEYARVGTTMKKLGYGFLFAILVMLSASTTKADAIDDPRIGGGGGSCASIDLLSLSQVITITAAELYQPTGPCIVDIVNETGTTLTSLVVTVNTPFAGLLSCYFLPGTSPFSVVSPSTPTATNECTFSGGSFLDEGVFGLQFGDPLHPFCGPGSTVTNGVCSNPLTSLDVTLHPTPEPASIALIGSGLAALVARRKKLGSEPLPNCAC